MGKFVLHCIFILLFLVGCNNNKKELNTVKPAEKGFSKSKLDTLGSHLEQAGSEALVIFADGNTAYSWGATDKKLLVHSIRKALLNSLYGIYIDNGTIDTTMTIGQLKIDDINTLTESEKTATIADLLKSRSGIYHSATAESKGMLASKPKRGSHKPNETYYYNNWDFNVLGYILEQQTGKTIFDLFNNHIAKPLGMAYSNNYTTVKNPNNNWEIPNVDGFYQFEDDKSKYPAYHFRLSAKDLARYGQLYLNKGQWNGKQIIPKHWIDVSTKPYSITNKAYGIGYGMLWSVLMPSKTRKSKSFFHKGVGVHMLAVYPESNMVLVHRVNTETAYTFNQGDFYTMIAKVWDAKAN